MKRRICLLSLLLMIALLIPMTSAAAESADDEVYAVATTLDGAEVILSDAPDASEIGALESYDLIVEDAPVLTVEQSDVRDLTSGTAQGGYFSADFLLPDSTKRVFLAGLCADKVEEIQSRLISAFADGADFQLEDMSFIDAEKMYPYDDGDDDLCWAATASNMLTYTGWAAQACFQTTDDVFEDFIASFTDDGGSEYFGFGWFFNGVNTFPLLNEEAASATEGTGGYLTDYAFDRLVTDVSLDDDPVAGMKQLHQAMRSGCGVGLSVYVYYQGEYYGGHADTCWGFVADTAYRDTDPNYYSGLFFTDSDSDQPLTGDRRDAENVLHAVSLSYTNNGFEYDLDRNTHFIPYMLHMLIPYSDEVEKETSSDATRNKVTTPDLAIDKSYFSTDPDNCEVQMEKIESKTTFWWTPVISNPSDQNCITQDTPFGIAITDNADGSVAYKKSYTTNFNMSPEGTVTFGSSLKYQKGLDAGDYTVTFTINEGHTAAEAYYYNNTYSFPLKVRDSYLLGDTNNSGGIDILDATLIQRYIACYDVGADDEMLQRARILGDKVNILDATNIQRHVAQYQTSYPIGEKRLYD